jgi:uncharacterized protein
MTATQTTIKGKERFLMPHSIKGTIECNMGCTYCYESTTRKNNKRAGVQAGYNVDKIIEFIENPNNNVNKAPNLHGGEPLLLPKKENEKLLKYIYEKFGETSIQTNGVLIDDDYIRMFKQYNTSVGVSIDGHEELNDGRWMGSEEKTRETTAKTIENIKRMRQEGIRVGLIVVVSKKNATADKLPKLKEFLLKMSEYGVRSGRLNLIELDYPELADELELSEEDAINFHREMPRFLRENDLRYAPFIDVVDALLGYRHRTCTTQQCDPFHTLGEQPIYGDGTKGNCLRTSKDGTVYLAEEIAGNPRVSNERYMILQQIPMSEGGCGGCRFWSICSAHCPGTAEDGDWRNKTTHCAAYKAMFEEIEKDLKQMMPNLVLTSEHHDNVSRDQMFKMISNGSASALVFGRMARERGAF